MEITATVRCKGQTGVEMEALTAVSVAALTIYDMAKAVERGMTISDIRLLEKRGGKTECGNVGRKHRAWCVARLAAFTRLRTWYDKDDQQFESARSPDCARRWDSANPR